MKRKNVGKMIIGTLFFLSLNVYPGGFTVGNGGNAIVCYDSAGKISSVNLLDYWEHQILGLIQNEQELDLGPSHQYLDQVHFVIDRLEKVDPNRATRLRDKVKNFQQNFFFFDKYRYKIELGEVHDYQMAGTPLDKNCFAKRYAVQGGVFNGLLKYPFLIDEEIFKSGGKGASHRAGIILHELVYEEAIQNGIQSSDQIRRYVNLISSKKMNTISTQEYVNAVLQFKMGSFTGVSMPQGEMMVSGLVLDKAGSPLHGYLTEPQRMNFLGRTVLVNGKLPEKAYLEKFGRVFVNVEDASRLDFVNGNLKRATLAEETEFDLGRYRLVLPAGVQVELDNNLQISKIDGCATNGQSDQCFLFIEGEKPLALRAKNPFYVISWNDHLYADIKLEFTGKREWFELTTLTPQSVDTSYGVLDISPYSEVKHGSQGRIGYVTNGIRRNRLKLDAKSFIEFSSGVSLQMDSERRRMRIYSPGARISYGDWRFVMNNSFFIYEDQSSLSVVGLSAEFTVKNQDKEVVSGMHDCQMNWPVGAVTLNLTCDWPTAFGIRFRKFKGDLRVHLDSGEIDGFRLEESIFGDSFYFVRSSLDGKVLEERKTSLKTDEYPRFSKYTK